MREKNAIVSAKTPEEKAAWLADLKEQISTLHRNAATLKPQNVSKHTV